MGCKIGIPRALMYHYFFPAWDAFFKELGAEVVLSPETNKKIVDNGVRLAVDDICLPFKVYYGHIKELKDKVDYLFVPRFISLGKDNYVCPKFMGLPDIILANFKNLPPLIEPTIDLRKGILAGRKIARKVGVKLGAGFLRIERAFRRALKRQRLFEDIQMHGYTSAEAIKLLNRKKIKINTVNPGDQKNKMKITVLAHSYITGDQYISMNIEKHLRKLGVDVSTVEMFDSHVLEDAAARQPKKSFWYFNRKLMGAAYYLFNNENKVDGLIQLTAFGCGPDSMIKELVDIKGDKYNIGILNINIDEHTGEAGLITRLEAFIDLLERRKSVCEK
ncbi:MAG: acyl-CoA dehydratase activase-related protein [Halanaerobiaceae bacterium]